MVRGAAGRQEADRPDVDHDELVLELPPEPGNVGLARLFVASVARHLGCEEDLVDDVKVAVSEAVTNAIKAHRDASVTGPVTLSLRPAGGNLIVEVIDGGRGLDTGPVEPVSEHTPPAGLFVGSLGITLIRALFPDTAIERNDAGGTTVRFRVPTP